MLGDVLGMPWEMKSAEQILKLTNGEGVTGRVEKAHTTDDWNLTDACAKSLIRRGRFDLLDLALAHVSAMERSRDGWGKTTVRAVSKMRDYFHTRGTHGWSPYDIRSSIELGKGRGNGVAMKVSPFVLWAICSNTALFEGPNPNRLFHLPDLMDQLLLLGCMTHPDPQASIAACGLATFLESVVLEHPSVMTGNIQERASWLLAQTINRTELISCGPHSDDRFGFRLQKLLDFDLLFGDISHLCQKIGTSSDALESVPFSLAIFLRHPNDFRTGVLEAVNAGGDTDTTASMTGALIGANVGSENIPAEWKESFPHRKISNLVQGMMDVNSRTSKY
jgi:ADP-ribosylglycohydrolase